MTEPTVLRKAEFNPNVKTYYMLSTIIVCVVTVVGIPLLIIAVPLGFVLIKKYLDNLAVTLTERTLEVRRGILSRTESTIPLEKITDLQMSQGPIMRAMDLHGFKVETAGQTTAGSLVSIIGIQNAPEFRKAVLEQRDRLAAGEDRPTPQQAAAEPDAVLLEIRDALLRIEQRLPNP